MSDSPDVRWEYTIFEIEGSIEFDEYRKDFIKGANRLGKEGWELVGLDTDLYLYIFKRRLP